MPSSHEDNQDLHEHYQDAPITAHRVSYDDQVDDEERMFLETLRGGQLAIQRRRHSLRRSQGDNSTSIDGIGTGTRNISALPRSALPADDDRSVNGSSSLTEDSDGFAVLRNSSRPPRLLRNIDVPNTSNHSSSLGQVSTVSSSTLIGTTVYPRSIRPPRLSSTTSVISERPTLRIQRQPLLLLYCSAKYDDSGTIDSESLPAGYYYTSEEDVSSSQWAASGNKAIKGGGCGQLICARAWSLSIPDQAFESDGPPLSSAVDWLEIIEPEGSAPDDDDIDIWPAPCRCLKAALGCRNCGNKIGVSTLVPCSACRRSSPAVKKWLFWSSDWTIRPRTFPVNVNSNEISGHNEQDKGAETCMYWDTESLPPIEEDEKSELVGGRSDWQASAEAFLRNECFSQDARHVLKRRRKNNSVTAAVEEVPPTRLSSVIGADLAADNIYNSEREFRRRRMAELTVANFSEGGRTEAQSPPLPSISNTIPASETRLPSIRDIVGR